MFRNAILVLVALLTGCASVARESDFETDSAQIDFSAMKNEAKKLQSNGFWTNQGTNYYFFEVGTSNAKLIINNLKSLISSKGYEVSRFDEERYVVIGKKIDWVWDWYSIIGAYVQRSGDHASIYIKVRITQDVTGGVNINRAKALAESYCEKYSDCI